MPLAHGTNGCTRPMAMTSHYSARYVCQCAAAPSVEPSESDVSSHYSHVVATWSCLDRCTRAVFAYVMSRYALFLLCDLCAGGADRAGGVDGDGSCGARHHEHRASECHLQPPSFLPLSIRCILSMITTRDHPTIIRRVQTVDPSLCGGMNGCVIDHVLHRTRM